MTTTTITFRPIDTWPGPLTPASQRELARFTAAYADTIDLLDRELYQLVARHTVIQLALTETDLRLDGLPRSGARPAHPGVILAFDSRVTFRQSRGPKVGDGVGEAGVLRIPVSGRPPGWIVDGQQRATALAKAKNQAFPVPVNAFIADDVALQRDQFLRVNNTRPLPSGLISELLPEVDTLLPPHLSARRLPSALVDVLNLDEDSPMRGMIRRASTAADDRAGAVITDTALVSAIEKSLTTPSGCLYSYRNLTTGETDTEGVKRILFLYWDAVRQTFPEAWGRSPKQSRLMHGAGIRAMGCVMDHVMRGVNPLQRGATQRVMKALEPLARVCRWTSGHWEELDGLVWNQVQNLPRHVNLLSSILVRAVLARDVTR